MRAGDDGPPLLAGALARAVFTGGDYPISLMKRVFNRIRIEGRASYLRAALLKAFLVRNYHLTILPMLDKENTAIGYRLGRLFAVLEKTQIDALGTVNAPIAERYYASASSTPRVVFPRLLRLFQHHRGKLSAGQAVSCDKLIQEIIDGLPCNGFPAHLDLKEQGLFAIGYYQQRKDFFTAKGDKALDALSE